MTMSVSIKVTGLDDVQGKLKKLGPDLYKFGSAMTSIGKRLKSYYSNEVFASQGGVFGTPWKRIQPASVKAKIRAGYRANANRTLVAKGDLRDSFTYDAKANSVTIENTDPKFKYHQSEEPRTKMPLRKMLGVNRDVENIVKDIVEADVRKKLDSLT